MWLIPGLKAAEQDTAAVRDVVSQRRLSAVRLPGPTRV